MQTLWEGKPHQCLYTLNTKVLLYVQHDYPFHKIVIYVTERECIENLADQQTQIVVI